MNPQIQKFVKLQRDSAFSNFLASQTDSETKKCKKRSRSRMNDSDEYGVEEDNVVRPDKPKSVDNSRKFNVRDPNHSYFLAFADACREV